MSHDTLICRKKDHVAWITLNRPDDGNVIDGQMAGEIVETCAAINQDKEIYVVVLTGAGRDFSRGGETSGAGAARALAGVDYPVIVAINGDAIGAGLELALAGDIRLATATARLGLPQVTWGMMPVDGGTQRLPRLVGRGKALEMLLTGAMISAPEAQEIGLVSQVVPSERLLDEAEKLAANIASKGPLALRYVKEAVIKGMDMTLEQGLRLEADLYFLLHTTADRIEGIRAFREKRPPGFRGE